MKHGTIFYLLGREIAFFFTLGVVQSALAVGSAEADAAFSAYNHAFFASTNGGGYYTKDTAGRVTDFWQLAEEIEMALDSYDRTKAPETKALISQLCHGFIKINHADWRQNKFNDDICWAAIAFCRAYEITGDSELRDRAKANFDMMYSRAWDTTFTGSGLWWTTEKTSKNACISGPAAIAACYLYSIYGTPDYLAKAQESYAWERRVLFNTNTGAIFDCINTNGSYNKWASTYNQGTFVGAGTLLYRFTGLPFYYQDALLAANHTRYHLTSAGILPSYRPGDLAGFNGIFVRWLGRMADEQNLWGTFGPWMNENAEAAWGVRNANNLSWYNWKRPTPGGTNVLNSWDCSSAVVTLQVACADHNARRVERPFASAVRPGNVPVELAGFNAAIIAANNTTNLGAAPFDIVNSTSFYQAGLGRGTRGLPPNGSFVSLCDSNTLFRFGPYGGTNALIIGKNHAASGALKFVAPRAYKTLAILATAANGSQAVSIVLEFTNGEKSQPQKLNSPDWSEGTTNVAIEGFGSLKIGSSELQFEDGGASRPKLYQTTLDLSAMGITQRIASLTFTIPNASDNQTTAIFAVSGAAAD